MDVEIREDMLCTFSGPQGTENICSGDSGSPLMILKGGKFVRTYERDTFYELQHLVKELVSQDVQEVLRTL